MPILKVYNSFFKIATIFHVESEFADGFSLRRHLNPYFSQFISLGLSRS